MMLTGVADDLPAVPPLAVPAAILLAEEVANGSEEKGSCPLNGSVSWGREGIVR